ncbi:allophanate hydrolase subunit 1 [Streptomyces sp. NPDC007025]|uniref:5-oxoprolinase subunit B family protein n=1 Tax=Streptomyces sp. NPDC007025 TaxID=3364771 RepID=UPI0036783830
MTAQADPAAPDPPAAPGLSAAPCPDAVADRTTEPAPPVIRPVGSRGLLVELATAEQAEALHAELLRRRADGSLPPVGEIVPGARTVLLDEFGSGAQARRLAAELPGWQVPPLTAGSGAVLEIPVRYDGPDLADVAALWGVAPDEAARRHAATEFRVAFCGFAPGFGYLTGLPEPYHVPRRATPRTRVPVGAVGLAGAYTGVYPRSSPGGWQLIGTAPETVLWDTARTPAALLAPGTRVRFVPLDGDRPSLDGDRPSDTGGPADREERP